MSNIIKVVKNVNFGTLYIKPAFLFQDDDGNVKLQFEADADSALGYLYNNLCKLMGLTWNYDSPSNDIGLYSNCAMHAAGDRAIYGCGPDNANSGGFCPQMTIAYQAEFQSEDLAAAFFARGNAYVDYWRSLYPSGVAVGTSNFCSGGGCLGLFLNRYDLYQVFKPDLGGSWVEYNGATFAPTISPAPTANGGCDNPHNSHLDKCFRIKHPKSATAVAWQSLGPVGQLSVFLVSFMAVTLSGSIFLARARKKRRRGESYLKFLVRDMRDSGKKDRRSGKKGKKGKKKKMRRMKNKSLEDDMLGSKSPRSKSKSRSKSRSRRPSSERSSSRRSRSKSHREEGSSRIKSRREEEGSSRSKSHREEEGSSRSKSHREEEGRSRSKSHREEEGRNRSKSRREEEGGSKRSSSKHRSSSKSGSSKHRSSSKRREDGERPRSSSRKRSSSSKKSGEDSSRPRSSSRSRSRSRSRREGSKSENKREEDMARRQLV